jgi:hypothetical protein
MSYVLWLCRGPWKVSSGRMVTGPFLVAVDGWTPGCGRVFGLDSVVVPGRVIGMPMVVSV